MRLTGQPRAFVGVAEVSFVPDKRYQLLSYLAYQGDWVGRDRLAFLFWPDTDSANARQNLRGLIQRLRTLPFDPALDSTPHQLRWDVRTDVAEYRAAVAEGDRERAASALHGSLLAGLEGDGTGEFEEWLEIERERLHADWRAVVLQRVRDTSPKEHVSARSLIDALLAVDPLDEEVVRGYLTSPAGSANVAEARAVYRTFVSHLEKEMGLEPTAETSAAFEGLVQAEAVQRQVTSTEGGGHGRVEGHDAPTVASLPSAARLPKPHTTFVGRERELAELEALLLDESCRLVTVVGPGGVGKTRLALAAAQRLGERFSSGSLFVPLDAVSSVEDVPQAIATALGLNAGGGNVLEQVTSALANSEMLLVLDNFEHVLAASDVVTRLLDASPSVKVLVTSRSRLELQSEWLFPLEGLEYPQRSGDLSEINDFDAVTLFVERARRVQPSFHVTEADVPVLVRVCTLMEGVPLAIELAASWARALPLEAIERDVSRNLDALSSSAKDGIARHASIRATFEQSWSILTEPERAALMRLAVFRSSIPAAAAPFVAGASNVLLAALVDKSLIRLRSNGRFALHPLLRVFAFEKLGLVQDEPDRTERRHAAYYLRFLRERTDAARGPRPAPVLAEIDAELPEILAAARTAQERGKGTQLVAFMRLLAVDTGYLPARGYGSERLALLTAAADVAVANGWLTSAHHLKGRLADAYATQLGEPVQALAAYQEAAELARADGDAAREAVLISMTGVMRSSIDDGTGEADLDHAMALAEAVDDDLCLATVLEHRAFVRSNQRNWKEACELYERSLHVVESIETNRAAVPYEIHRRRFFALVSLGESEWQMARFDAALEARSEALRIAELSGNPIWVAHASLELGEMYGTLGDDSLSQKYLARARDLYRENNVTVYLDRLESFAQSRGYQLQQPVLTA